MTATTNVSAVRLRVTAKSVLSYAMAHNRVPIVDRIELHYTGPDVNGATVHVEVRDAHGLLSAPCTGLVDLTSGAVTVLQDVPVAVNPATMLQVEEQRPGTVVVRVEKDGTLLGEHETDIQLLAARQWFRHPTMLGLEMLAAFVMPNDPAVAGVVSDAAEILQRRTGSPSTEGYQSGPERVDAIVQALFEAMQARQVRYSEPPASWADRGQKVRTPSEVLEGRTGTCLDTVVVLAAVMEHAGIRPLLWLVDGHAFVGYWRVESSLDASAQVDASDLVNYIDLGLIKLVETTMVTVREEPHAFTDTHRPPYARYLIGDLPRSSASLTFTAPAAARSFRCLHADVPRTAAFRSLSIDRRSTARRPLAPPQRETMSRAVRARTALPYRRESSNGRTRCST